ALVVWRRPADRIALLTGAFLLCGSVAVAAGPLRDAAAASSSTWALLATGVHALAAVAFGLFLALFPDGRWVPAWTRWLLPGWSAFVLPHLVSPWPPALLLPLLLSLIGASVYAQ